MTPSSSRRDLSSGKTELETVSTSIRLDRGFEVQCNRDVETADVRSSRYVALMAKAPPRRSRPTKTPMIDVDPKACIAILTNRIAEIDALADFTDGDDGRFQIAQNNIASAVLEIFGPDSIEFDKYEHHHIWRGAMYLNMHPRDIRLGRIDGLEDTKVALQSLIGRIQERISVAPAHAVRDARAAFSQLTIHPRILAACRGHFEGAQYRSAILDAGIALVDYVKERAGSPADSTGKPLDGTPLMQHVFTAKAPILKVNDLKSPSDQDEQLGMMYLFSGVTSGLRNPRAHSLDPDTAEYAIEAISLISFLAKVVDTAKK